jgi:uncharacterized protein (DUF1330 family)
MMEKIMKARYTVTLSTLVGIGLGVAAVQGIHAQVEPPIYYVSEIEVTNLDGYLKEYLPRAEANINAFGGRILAAGTKVASLEGDPPKSRVTLQVWDSIETIQSWRNSAEFKRLHAVGQRYAKFRAFVVEGLR